MTNFRAVSAVFLLTFLSSLPAAAVDIETARLKYENQQWLEAYLDLQILAEEQNAEAQGYLGMMYRRGWGVQQDFAQAERYLRAGAEGGDPMAQHRLGWMYARGEVGGKNDMEAAVALWQQAAEAGNPEAQADVGVMYWSGKVIPEDKARAYAWLSLSAAQGNTAAVGNLDRLKEEMTESEVAAGETLYQNMTASP